MPCFRTICWKADSNKIAACLLASDIPFTVSPTNHTFDIHEDDLKKAISALAFSELTLHSANCRCGGCNKP